MVALHSDRCRLLGCLALVLTAGASMLGCAGNCASNCPPLVFAVTATSGESLSLATAQWVGPACPLYAPTCRADSNGNSCAIFSMNATTPGNCELDLTFGDGRPPFRAQTEFGPETHQGCCHGFPVIGPSVVVIPPRYPIPGDDASIDTNPGSDDAAVDATPDSSNDSD